MKTITLSDHVQQQTDAAIQQRQAVHDALLQRYEIQVAQRHREIDGLKVRGAVAWAEGRYLSWAANWVSRLWKASRAKPVKPYMAAASQEERVWEAGSEGERRVRTWLAGVLSDDWVAISGYHNPGGEADLVLVGPDGVLAIEVKYINGLVHCDGDRWWRDKFDKFGNLVESNVPIADKKGRGPSAQVNAVADRLQGFLNERSPVKRVARAVVLSHDASRLGEVRSRTVDNICVLSGLRVQSILDEVNGLLSAADVQGIVRLIEQDHHFHLSRRQRRVQRSA
jgi:hypothetical protein